MPTCYNLHSLRALVQKAHFFKSLRLNIRKTSLLFVVTFHFEFYSSSLVNDASPRIFPRKPFLVLFIPHICQAKIKMMLLFNCINSTITITIAPFQWQIELYEPQIILWDGRRFKIEKYTSFTKKIYFKCLVLIYVLTSLYSIFIIQK